ncbi:hypothetical protein BGZ57DRAFT_853190 [Hyaloscypha finlandica]|nr:hypothetical protein BGZ57DRAFT_853190 [Hyaloscypha finlandica]
MDNDIAESGQSTTVAITADATSDVTSVIQSRTGRYFDEATHQSRLAHHQQIKDISRDDGRDLTFSLSFETPKGLGGNFDGWKKSSVYSTSSEIFQWTTARSGGAYAGEADETEPYSELKMITADQGKFLLRELATGKFLAYGQLAIDRQPSEELMNRRYDWAAAIEQRSRSVHNRGREPRRAGVHHCPFCDSPPGNPTGPTWLFDCIQRKTVCVTEEFPDGPPPYEVLSYTWGRAASNEWEEVQGIPWQVRSSTGLPISRILEALSVFSGTYIWIDIFCIPQNCPSAKAREIARQAQIFRGATGGVAWLHQTAAVLPLVIGIASWALLLNEQFSQQGLRPTIPPPIGTFAAVEELISDPWFSSTWALQEAVLRPNMFMIGASEWKNALFFPHGSLDRSMFSSKPVTLGDFRGYLSILRAVASSTIKTGIHRPLVQGSNNTLMRAEDALRLEKLFQDAGLLGLITPTPAAILSSLSVHSSVKPHDQFYGIQAVFNLALQGDYERPLDSVRGEFLGHVWTEYAPILALALNRPVITSNSANFLSDSEDCLLWFSHAQLKGGRLPCSPPGSSSVRATFNIDGFPTFTATESTADDPWHYEARSLSPAHSNILLIRYGLPPIPITIHSARISSFYDPEAHHGQRWWNKIPLLRTIAQWWRAWSDRTGKTRWLSRTTRLMYVGRFINETGHLGLRRKPYVYIEYYLTASGVGQRVGALLSDLPFEHRRVDGAVTFP